MTEVATYCRICEPQCGLIATVEDGRLTTVRPDKDHAHSEGFMCTKAVAMVEVTYDPDRVLQPLKRVGGPGEFEPVSWDEALADIAGRLTEIRRTHGAAAVASFLGNPPAFGYATALTYSGFQEALDIRWRYSINSEDAAARVAANALLYGSPVLMPVPDIPHTDFALILGANPVVSKGSLVSIPNFGKALDDVVSRGGRVVVVDPRRSETARRYEHVGLRAGTDAHLLLAMLHTVIAHDAVDRNALADHTTGFDALTELVAPFTPQAAEAVTGIAATQIEQLSLDFATAERAVVYGRTGTCTQRFGTLNNLLQDLLTIVTGNLERRGGLLFGWGPIDFATFAEKGGFATYNARPSRITGHPDVMGMHPSTSMVPDITVPGDDQVRALVVVGGNPVNSSAGGGEALADALEQLDLHVSLDLYVNETNRHAHYVLPVPAMYERDDLPLPTLGLQVEPSIWATEAVIEPLGDVRPEWKVLDEIVRRMGLGGAYAVAPLRRLAKLGIRPGPRTLADIVIRTSRVGDWFGLRPKGLSFKKLTRRHPHGVRLRDALPVTTPKDRLRTPDRRIALDLPALRGELERLRSESAPGGRDDGFPLRLIGMREVRSHNSWMHNAPRLMPDQRRQAAQVHPEDAAAIGLADGDQVTIRSRSGAVTVEVNTTDDMTPGNVALPHGWGHRGGWQRANAAGGANSNDLASADPSDVEPLAGMSTLNGIPIRLEPVGSTSLDRDPSSLGALR